MATAVIACRTIEDELTALVQRTGCPHTLIWIEAGLHNDPVKLHNRLQQELDGCEGVYDTVLLCMGTCGNSVKDLNTGSFSLILPRVDDCITLLLGSMDTRRIANSAGTYFMTEGWLRGERNIWKEYEYAIQKYGEKRGKRIFEVMFANYHHLKLVDTGCYDMIAAEKEARKMAVALNMEYGVLPGTLCYMEQLLTGPWPEERFIVVPPHGKLTDVTV